MNCKIPHLGNVRQVVRAPQSNLRVATMEPENAAEEEELFQNVNPDNYRDRQGDAEHNKTPGGYATAWLNADRGRILGPSRSQEIQEGDSIEIGVFGTPMATLGLFDEILRNLKYN